jgi:hypothetical protein
MDFADLDMASAADAGADLHLRHPATDEPLYDGKTPVLWRIVGRDSKRVQDAVKAANKLQVAGKIDAEEAGVRGTAAAVIAWPKGTKWQGKEVECTPENVAMMLRARPWLAEQIGPFAMARANFASNMSKD